MTLANRNVWLAVGVVAALQAIVLVWMIWDRTQLLANGREIVLEVVPVDPRSLFRGDYVILNYAINRVATPEATEGLKRGSDVYVTLKKGAQGYWDAVDASASRPASVGPDSVVVKGRVQYSSRSDATNPPLAGVKYGIESYFVPEGAGEELEKLVGQKKIAALVAVGEDGTAAIKGLVVDGQPVYEEPLF